MQCFSLAAKDVCILDSFMVSVMELDMMLVMVLVTGRVGHGSFHGFSFGVNRGVWRIFFFPKSHTNKIMSSKMKVASQHWTDWTDCTKQNKRHFYTVKIEKIFIHDSRV